LCRVTAVSAKVILLDCGALSKFRGGGFVIRSTAHTDLIETAEAEVKCPGCSALTAGAR
jgi:hypothetical protein